MKIRSHNFMKSTAKRGAERVLLAVFCIFIALLIAVGGGASTLLPVYAAEYTAYDRSAIEDDLKEIDAAAYPADENGRHFLLDDVGFMEYGYSKSRFIAQNYFGIYLYVYNPTEREVSTRAGANAVNMATAYDDAGEPTNYENVPITVLDHTENHRFYKFRITDGAAVYERARAYAEEHDGERRYDIASVQIWFAGDRNATDSFTERNQRSVTYRCTGYAAGCGTDSAAPSTLDIRRDKLESVELDVQKTFWRTQTSRLGYGHQNQLDTVYFTVPQRLFDEYGTLQRIKAEWWEYKTKPIIVMENDIFCKEMEQYIAVHLPEAGGSYLGYKDDSIPYEFYAADGSGYPLYLWNSSVYKNADEIFLQGTYLQTLYYVFSTHGVSIEKYDPYGDIVSTGGVSSNALEKYIFGYEKSFESGKLNVKDGTISADLFEADIDESRKANNERGKIRMGYSYYDFDVEEDVQQIVSWADGDPSWWDNWQEFGFWDSIFGDIPEEEGRSFSPIYIPKEEDFSGSPEAIADRLMCQLSDVEKLRSAYETEEEILVMFRFAVSDYMAAQGSTSKYETWNNPGLDDLESSPSYIAQQSVFLDFDIIQLTFKNDDEKMTVIPAVASPIDIIDPITPPTDFSNGDWWTLVWWLAGAALGVVAVGIVVTIIEKEVK